MVENKKVFNPFEESSEGEVIKSRQGSIDQSESWDPFAIDVDNIAPETRTPATSDFDPFESTSEGESVETITEKKKQRELDELQSLSAAWDEASAQDMDVDQLPDVPTAEPKTQVETSVQSAATVSVFDKLEFHKENQGRNLTKEGIESLIESSKQELNTQDRRRFNDELQRLFVDAMSTQLFDDAYDKSNPQEFYEYKDIGYNITKKMTDVQGWDENTRKELASKIMQNFQQKVETEKLEAGQSRYTGGTKTVIKDVDSIGSAKPPQARAGSISRSAGRAFGFIIIVSLTISAILIF